MPGNNETETPQVKKQKKAGSKKLWIIILIVLLVIAGSSAGAYLLYFKSPAGEAAGAKKAKPAEVETLDMGEMIVNLAGNGGSHYLRVEIVLEHPKNKKLVEELSKKKHQVSDILLSTLRSKTLSDVSPPGSMDGLKAGLLKEINTQLEHGEVTGMYFTDFLVQ